jgi:hypothetical protein
MYGRRIGSILQDNTSGFVPASLPGEESSPSSVLEHFTDTFTSFRRAFQIVFRTDLLGNCHTLLDVKTQSVNACQSVRKKGNHIESARGVFERNKEITNLFGADRLLTRSPETINYPLIPSKILLATYEDDGQPRAEVHDLRNPLCGK